MVSLTCFSFKNLRDVSCFTPARVRGFFKGNLPIGLVFKGCKKYGLKEFEAIDDTLGEKSILWFL